MVKDFTGCMHVGNHVLISYLSEAQVRLLTAIGFPELSVDGKVCISTNLSAEFLSEVHHGDKLVIDTALGEVGQKSYELIFRVTSHQTSQTTMKASMGMCFVDLESHRVVDLPGRFIAALKSSGGMLGSE